MGHDMDVPVALPVLVRRMLVSEQAKARIGAEDVDRAVVGFRSGHQVPDCRFARHVAGDSEAPNPVCDRAHCVILPVDADHSFRAFGREALSQGPADSAAGAGHHRHLVLKLHAISPPLRSTALIPVASGAMLRRRSRPLDSLRPTSRARAARKGRRGISPESRGALAGSALASAPLPTQLHADASAEEIHCRFTRSRSVLFSLLVSMSFG